MENTADISIMGCGWLGLPLAEKLVQNGFRVKGSTTTAAKLDVLQEKQIKPYLIHLDEDYLDEEQLASFLDTKVLVLNIPPRIRSGQGDQLLPKLLRLRKAMLESPVSRVLFVSSTAVYLDLNRIVKEEDIHFTEEQEPDNILLQAERVFQDREDWVTTIVRFGGLVGENRQPGRFMAGKVNLPDGDAPVNLIHLDDCLAILYRILEQDLWGCTYNACADEHPLRKDFYTQAARAIGATPPTFLDMEATRFKRINSDRLKQDLAYNFLHPDPMLFF
ncbi:SDR family NAD(P)-dependent oxidoreductase [Pontibacter qinzhouensis]|uniref:SDR family NAD(P)-dependent oxidoreductase n=1 Tax=Pontibacter qinzhouensis TaxID=2603253 RepID=A0A5C8J311_9BACT|nr:SDR family NAD(P)-dependent oxidoreductase [Pontibacter qinzhouensis]TXK29675.1 SDR family NAD(P)-dependent oxidoreductase [Pontibacter qinzhouensis]